MKHPIFKIAISIVLVAIVVSGLYLLFSIVSTSNKDLQFINWHKAILYGSAVVGSVVGILLIHAKIKQE